MLDNTLKRAGTALFTRPGICLQALLCVAGAVALFMAAVALSPPDDMETFLDTLPVMLGMLSITAGICAIVYLGVLVVLFIAANGAAGDREKTTAERERNGTRAVDNGHATAN